MISVLRNIFKRPKLHVEVSVDHVELAETYMMIGLNLAWHNEMADPIPVREVQLKLFHQGAKEELIWFQSQGHFTRVPNQRVINKILGAKSFELPAGASHMEHIRFFTRTIFDLPEGKYPVEIHAQVPGGTYLHETDITITRRMKYRTSEAWVTAENETQLPAADVAA